MERLILSGDYSGVDRDIIETDTVPTDDDIIGCCFGICLTPDAKKVCLTYQRNRGWEHPGGTREPGETLEECLHREVMEEVGLTKITNAGFLGVRKFYNKGGDPHIVHYSQKSTRVSYCLLYLTITEQNPDLTLLNLDDVVDAKYFSVEEASDLLTPGNNAILQLAIQKRGKDRH